MEHGDHDDHDDDDDDISQWTYKVLDVTMAFPYENIVFGMPPRRFPVLRMKRPAPKSHPQVNDKSTSTDKNVNKKTRAR